MTTADGGDWVEVAFVANEGEASMVQGLLEGNGIPSLTKGIGVQGPRVGVGWLPNNPHRVLAPSQRAEQARSLIERALAENEAEALAAPSVEDLEEAAASRGRGPRGYGVIGAYARAWIWSAVAMALIFGLFLLFRAL
jgi:hypothetical protein